MKVGWRGSYVTGLLPTSGNTDYRDKPNCWATTSCIGNLSYLYIGIVAASSMHWVCGCRFINNLTLLWLQCIMKPPVCSWWGQREGRGRLPWWADPLQGQSCWPLWFSAPNQKSSKSSLDHTTPPTGAHVSTPSAFTNADSVLLQPWLQNNRDDVEVKTDRNNLQANCVYWQWFYQGFLSPCSNYFIQSCISQSGERLPWLDMKGASPFPI